MSSCEPTVCGADVLLFQSGLPAMSLDILSQFPTPPVPNFPAMAMAMPAVLTHQQPIMPSASPAVMPMAPSSLAQPSNSFIANFPPVQVTPLNAVICVWQLW